MEYNLQNWQSTFANPTSNLNRGVLGSAFNTNPLTARGMNILGSNIAYGLPLAYASMASKLQQSLPKSLTGDGGIADQNPYYGAMGVAVDPEVEETLRYGDAVTGTNYPGANRPLNTLDPNWQHQIRMQEIDRGNIDNRFSFNPLNWGIGGMMKKVIEPNTPEENFGRDYFKDSMDSSGRIYNDAEDLFGGKIPVSAWGQGMSAAGQKRMDTIENTLKTKYGLNDAQIADIYAGSFDEEESGINTPLIQRLQNFKNQHNRYNKALAAATGGKDTTGGAVTTGNVVTNVTNPNQGDGASRDQGGGYSTRGGFTGTRSAPGPRGTTTPASGRGHHSWAEGGRIGYRTAGPVFGHDEPSEPILEFMQDQNIPFSDQVEGEGGILEQLVAKYIEAGFPPDEAEAMALQEFEQMAADSGQGEGIASLV